MGRFRPPRDVPDFGLKPEEQARFKAWIRTALVEIAEDLAELGRTDTSTVIEQESVTVPAGALRRVTPPVGGMGAVLPAPTAANTGQTARIMIEAPVGALTVESAPGVNDAGQVFLPTINGQPRATFTASGLVTFTSNGVNDWKSSAEFAAESAAGRAGATAQAALDATYVLETPHPSLPNAGQATDTAEIDFSFVPGGAATWSLIDGGVPLTRLEDIPDQRVLGNDSGADGPVTPITVHQELDWVGGDTPVSWPFDGVDDRVNFGDVRDFERTTAFTLSGWFQTTTGANDSLWVKQAVGSPFTGYFLEVETGFLRFFFRGTSIGNEISVRTTTATFADGSRHHVVVSYTGSSLASGVAITVDGVAQTLTVETDALSTSPLNAGNLYIGFPSAGSFDGLLTDMAIWNVALTLAQRAEIYNGGTPPDLLSLPTAPAPVKWIKMNASDATGALGIIDYGTDAVNGTAEGGLAPVSGIGSILARGSVLWQIVPPGTDGLPLLSQGPGAIPAYEALTNAGLAPMAANTYKGNATGSSAVPQDVAISGLAGAGMTATGSVLNVIGSTSITVNANDIQRPALTGFAAASANSNATTSAEPIVTYSASANMSAERVTTSSTSVTVSTSVANQIEFQRAAVSGAVVLAANANTSVFAGIQDGGAATTDRTNLNFIDGTNTTAVLTDDAGGDRINIAVNVTGITSSGAVTGAVGILAGGGNATFNGILDNGAAENNRTLLNYVNSTSNTAVITDDAINDELEITFQRAALTGDVTAGANSNATTIANDAVTNAKAANMAANTVKANPTTGSADPQDVAIGTHEIVARSAGNVAGIPVGTDTGVANIGEGGNTTGLGAQPRDEMHRWLNSTPNVSVFEEEFQGNLAAMSGRFTATAGYALSASATANAEIWGLLGITQGVGNVAAALTLGASEAANCFRHEKARYVCLVVRNSTGITADTAFAVGLVGPFDVYGGGLQGRIAGTSEGRFFSYNTALSANWHCGYRSGSTTAVTDSGVAAANLTRYVFEWFQTDAGAVQMYVNGTLVRTDGAGNGPAAGECTFYLSSLGSTAAARTWQFDYIKVVSQSANRFGG